MENVSGALFWKRLVHMTHRCLNQSSQKSDKTQRNARNMAKVAGVSESPPEEKEGEEEVETTRNRGARTGGRHRRN